MLVWQSPFPRIFEQKDKRKELYKALFIFIGEIGQIFFTTRYPYVILMQVRDTS